MKPKLRLLLFEKCNRNCNGCCNKDWDLTNLPVENDFSKYSKVLLTGGEPMLNPKLIIEVAKRIKEVNNCPIYLYTAKVDDIEALMEILFYIDGITVTLHEQKDLEDFKRLDKFIRLYYWIHNHHLKSLRLNVFKGIDINASNIFKKTKPYPLWKIKDNMEWMKNYPLPENEVFCRLKRR